jgi:hypothetical protein
MATGINPVIAAFMEATQRASRDFQAGEDRKQRQQQLDQESKHQQAQIDLQQAILEAQQLKDKATLKNQVVQQKLENYASGIERPQGTFGPSAALNVVPESQPGDIAPYVDSAKEIIPSQFTPDPNQYVDTGMETIGIPSSTIVTPQVKADMERQQLEQNLPLIEKQSFAKSSGEAKGKLPLVQAENEARIQLEGIKTAADWRKTLANINAKHLDTQIAANSRIEAAKVRAAGQQAANEDDIYTLAMNGIFGEGKLGVSNKDTKAKTVIRKAGFTEFSNANQQKLLQLHGFDGIKEDMEKFAAKFIPPGTQMSQANMDRIWAAIPASEMNNFRAMIVARAGNVAHGVGGEVGRLTDKDIDRAVGILVIPGITYTQMQERLKSLTSELSNKATKQIMGNLPPAQQLLILQKNQFDPAQMNYEIKKGIPAFRRNGAGSWLAFDEQAGGWKKVGLPNATTN